MTTTLTNDNNHNITHTMKHILLLFTVFIATFAASPAMAQKNGKGSQQRIAHMAQILQLDDATAATFYSVYGHYRQEMKAARQKYHRIKPPKNQDGTPSRLTDEQVKRNIENSFDLSQSILDIRKKYYKEFQKILSPRQIERLYELEKKDGERLREMAKKTKHRNK